MKKTTALLMLSTFVAAPLATAALDSETKQAIQAAIDHPDRNAKNKTRDQYRKPMDVLDFMDFKADMTVVEMWPAGGWYTEVLAPALKDKGQYIAAHYPVNPSRTYQRRYLGQFLQMVSDTERFGNVQVTAFDLPYHTDIAPKGSADMVLTFRNAHDWMMGSSAPFNAVAYKAMFDALKPGGVLGVVDHQWDDPETWNPNSGYIPAATIIEVAESVGFEFVEESQVLDNPKDTKDHPRGVWTLPPSMALKDKDAEKYRAIGESDRFVLKFRKPE